jgi:5-(carboxyamino)imidazole ribonucleotide mutase
MADPRVGIVMGSESDLEVMLPARDVLRDFGIQCEVRVLSAHRRPFETLEYGQEAIGRGLRVLIAGAGGAAALPGALASATPLPVIGVPVPLTNLDGLDSLLSMVQMPSGIPVATVAIGGARNAGILAARILALSDAAVARKLDAFMEDNRDKSLTQDIMVQERLKAMDER